MLRILPLVAVASLSTAALLMTGCQDQNAKDTGTMTTPSAASAGTGYNNGGPAGIPDNSRNTTGGTTSITGSPHVGTENRSATLGGGSTNDPNATTPGGGQ